MYTLTLIFFFLIGLCFLTAQKIPVCGALFPTFVIFTTLIHALVAALWWKLQTDITNTANQNKEL